MRIAAVGDIHLGNHGAAVLPDGTNRRFSEIAFWAKQAFRMVEGADAVVQLGDLWHSNHPTVTQYMAALDSLSLLATVHVLAGNHDRPRTSGPPAASPIARQQTVLHGDPAVIELAGVALAFMPWPTMDCIRGVATTSIGEANEAKGAYVKETLWDIYDNIPRGSPSILCAHLPILEATTGSDKFMLACSGEWGISADDIPPFTATVLGHIHKRQCLRADPPVWYVGSVCQISAHDAGNPGGFAVVDIGDDGRAEIQFTDLESPQFVTHNILGDIECVGQLGWVPNAGTDYHTFNVKRAAGDGYDGADFRRRLREAGVNVHSVRDDDPSAERRHADVAADDSLADLLVSWWAAAKPGPIPEGLVAEALEIEEVTK